MKRIGLTAVALLFAAATFAQTSTAPTSTTPATSTEVKAQMKDMRKDVRAYNKEKAEAKHDINQGKLADAKADLTAAQADK